MIPDSICYDDWLKSTWQLLATPLYGLYSLNITLRGIPLHFCMDYILWIYYFEGYRCIFVWTIFFEYIITRDTVAFLYGLYSLNILFRRLPLHFCMDYILWIYHYEEYRCIFVWTIFFEYIISKDTVAFLYGLYSLNIIFRGMPLHFCMDCILWIYYFGGYRCIFVWTIFFEYIISKDTVASWLIGTWKTHFLMWLTSFNRMFIFFAGQILMKKCHSWEHNYAPFQKRCIIDMVSLFRN